MQKIVNLSLIFLLALSISCGSTTDTSEIKKVAEKFTIAMAKLDFETAKEFGTSQTKAMISIAEMLVSKIPKDKLEEAKKDIKSLKFGDIEIDGNEAIVYFETELKGSDKIKLKKVNGEWKVNMKMGF